MQKKEESAGELFVAKIQYIKAKWTEKNKWDWVYVSAELCKWNFACVVCYGDKWLLINVAHKKCNVTMYNQFVAQITCGHVIFSGGIFSSSAQPLWCFEIVNQTKNNSL